ncbi:MAG: protein phosphatase CheZ [Burkholderiaceae bacterium]|nr:protein phosphatase CheZ [Burkholderiaceae bacterium]
MSTPTQFVEDAAHSADLAVDRLDDAAQQAHNHLAEKAHNAVNAAKPVMDRLAKDAESIARRGLETARETSRQLRERAAQASDSTVQYIKDEPVKAMLIAAAAGAALVTVIGLLSRSRRGD